MERCIVNKEPMVYSSEYPFSVKSTKINLISFDAGIASLELPWLQNQNKWFFADFYTQVVTKVIYDKTDSKNETMEPNSHDTVCRGDLWHFQLRIHMTYLSWWQAYSSIGGGFPLAFGRFSRALALGSGLMFDQQSCQTVAFLYSFWQMKLPATGREQVVSHS